MTDFGERRRAQRVDASLRMQVFLDEGSDRDALTEIEMVNISTSGVYFRSRSYMAPMTKLALSLELSVPGTAEGETEHALIQCQGLVVRIDPEEEQPAGADYDIAVFFTWIEPDSQVILEQHISVLMDAT